MGMFDNYMVQTDPIAQTEPGDPNYYQLGGGVLSVLGSWLTGGGSLLNPITTTGTPATTPVAATTSPGLFSGLSLGNSSSLLLVGALAVLGLGLMMVVKK